MDAETIKQLNELLKKLEETSSLELGRIPEMGLSQDRWDGLCGILYSDRWINKPWSSEQGNVINISRSNNFKSLLLTKGSY